MKRLAITALLLVVGFSSLLAAEGGPRGSRIKDITTLSEEQLNFMEYCRRHNGPVGQWFLSPMIGKRSLDIRKTLGEQGAGAVADRILATYETDRAWLEITAVAVGLLHEAGYGYKLSTRDRGLDRELDKSRPNKEDPQKLTEMVNELVDEEEIP